MTKTTTAPVTSGRPTSANSQSVTLTSNKLKPTTKPTVQAKREVSTEKHFNMSPVEKPKAKPVKNQFLTASVTPTKTPAKLPTATQSTTKLPAKPAPAKR